MVLRSRNGPPKGLKYRLPNELWLIVFAMAVHETRSENRLDFITQSLLPVDTYRDLGRHQWYTHDVDAMLCNRVKLSILLTCKLWNTLGTSLIYQSVHLPGRTNSVEGYSLFLDERNLASFVKALCLEGPALRAPVEQIIDLLSRMSRLQALALVVDSSVGHAVDILRLLAPSISIHKIRNFTCRLVCKITPSEYHDLMKAIAPSIEVLDLSITYTGGDSTEQNPVSLVVFPRLHTLVLNQGWWPPNVRISSRRTLPSSWEMPNLIHVYGMGKDRFAGNFLNDNLTKSVRALSYVKDDSVPHHLSQLYPNLDEIFLTPEYLPFIWSTPVPRCRRIAIRMTSSKFQPLSDQFVILNHPAMFPGLTVIRIFFVSRSAFPQSKYIVRIQRPSSRFFARNSHGALWVYWSRRWAARNVKLEFVDPEVNDEPLDATIFEEHNLSDVDLARELMISHSALITAGNNEDLGDDTGTSSTSSTSSNSDEDII